jgi:hypothetical protein
MTMRYVHPAEKHKKEVARKFETFKALLNSPKELSEYLQSPLQCNESDENDGSQVIEIIGRGVRI